MVLKPPWFHLLSLNTINESGSVIDYNLGMHYSTTRPIYKTLFYSKNIYILLFQLSIFDIELSKKPNHIFNTYAFSLIQWPWFVICILRVLLLFYLWQFSNLSCFYLIFYSVTFLTSGTFVASVYHGTHLAFAASFLSADDESQDLPSPFPILWKLNKMCTCSLRAAYLLQDKHRKFHPL